MPVSECLANIQELGHAAVGRQPMSKAAGYRIGACLFALTVVICLAVLPFAASCCSHLSSQEQALSATVGHAPWAAGITPLAVALLDWPMGFRLLLLTLTAAILCLVATLASAALSRRSIGQGWWSDFARGVLACFTVGVLYILAAYVTGYFGYLGPANVGWMLGIPALVAFMNIPRPIGLLFSVPLALGGWIGAGVISLTIGIPLD